jgi:streptogramin lyase
MHVGEMCKEREANRFAAFAVALCAVVALLFSAASAQAALTHPFLPELSHEEAFQGEAFFNPCGAATDSQGDLYVADYSADMIYVYDPAGALLTKFTPTANAENPCALAVDSAGNIYVNGWGTDVVRYAPAPSAYPPTAATTYAADTALNGTGTLVASGATSVAVDPASDDVYVAEGSHISSYEADGTLISNTIGEAVAGASYYGVDVYGANGDVYATDVAGAKAYVLRPGAGEEVRAEIDGSDSIAGAFGPNSTRYLAVDQTNGHVFVNDVGAHEVVDEFDAAGHFVSQLQHSFADGQPTDIAVDNSAGPNRGTVYVTSNPSSIPGSVYAFGPLPALTHPFLPELSHEEAFQGEAFFNPCGAATDSQGDLYVADYSADMIYVYDPAGALLTKFTPTANAENPCALAVDSAGNIYVNGWGTDVVRYAPAPSAYPPTAATTYAADTALNGTGTLVASGATSVAVDPASDDVYVAEGSHISSYEADGTLISNTIGEAVAGASYYGVDVYGANGDVYATDVAGAKAYVLRPGAGEEVRAEIDGSDSIAGAFGPNSTRYLAVDQTNGHVFVNDVGAHEVVDEFDAAGHFVSQLQHSFADGQPTDIAVDNSAGPNRGTVYVTSNPSSIPGSVYAFGPLSSGSGGPPPDVTLGDPYEVTAFSARIDATIDPHGEEVEWRWETSNDPTCAGGYFQEALQRIPAGEPGAVDVEGRFDVSGHWCVRLSASSGGGTSTSEVKELTTPAAPPTTLTISDVGPFSAHASGTFDRGFEGTDWVLELSTDPACAGGFSGVASGRIDDRSPGSRVIDTDIESLLPRHHYCARLSVSRSGSSPIEEFTTSGSRPEALFAGPRLNTSARLNAHFAAEAASEEVTYHFEYSADGGSSWQALPDHTYTSEGTSQIVISQDLDGLQPGTAYAYRVVVEVDAGTTQSEEASFRTRSTAEVSDPASCPNEEVRSFQHSTHLGDCRGIELVSNPDNGNQNVSTFGPLMLGPVITPDGEKALWSVIGGAPGGVSGSQSTFLANRTPSGWVSRSVVPPAAEQLGGGERTYRMLVAAPGFSSFLFAADYAGLEPQDGQALLMLDREQHQEILTSYPNAHLGGGASTTFGVDMTDDGSHAFAVNPETKQLEDVGPSAHEVISVMPDGALSQCGLQDPTSSFTGVAGGGFASTHWRGGYHRFGAVDGSRVYFETAPNGQCAGAVPVFALYQRNRESGITTLIDSGSVGNPNMIRATADGRSIYFTTASRLDPGDENEDLDVYRWDEETDDATCLTCVVSDADIPPDAGVLVSDDFSHVYFQSLHHLAPGATSGELNIFVLSGGEVRFVADAGPGDSPVANLFMGKHDVDEQTAQTSPDGTTLLFLTKPNPDLTSDVVSSACGGECLQLYRYDDRTREVVCISCLQHGVTTSESGRSFSAIPKRKYAMSADGRVIAFVTNAALVRGDVNGGIDIYEWHDGIYRLITDGLTDYPTTANGLPIVRGISADGRDIFYAAADGKRTGFEKSTLTNFYDARSGGGFLPPPRPDHCSEESCQGPLQGAPTAPHPATSHTESRGNEARPRHRRKPCAKKHGRAKKRCLKKHRKTTHRHLGGTK